MRVLYIDDDRINTLLFEQACSLNGAGIEVASASDGAEAIETALSFQPDVLVVDLHLPDTNGYELLPKLRGVLARPSTPAFLCTADELALVMREASAAGFDGCWAKPVELESMLADLARVGHPAPPSS